MLIAAVLRSSAEGTDERRAARRHNIRLDASVDFDGQPIPFPCVIVDVSASGAQLFVRLPAGVDEMKLEIEGFDSFLCRVVWRSDTRAGIKFVNDAEEVTRRLAALLKGG
ncbi:MAG: PilZ domain-containing protein [Alphaproteobacteria bacterium]